MGTKVKVRDIRHNFRGVITLEGANMMCRGVDQRTADGSINLLLSVGRTDPGIWTKFRPDSEVEIWEPGYANEAKSPQSEMLKLDREQWYTDCEDWLSNIDYWDGYALDTERVKGGIRVRVAHLRPDRDTGIKEWGYGGWANFEVGTPEIAVVQAAFGLFQSYEIHECREGFKYKGLRIYGPHMTLDALMEAAMITARNESGE